MITFLKDGLTKSGEWGEKERETDSHPSDYSDQFLTRMKPSFWSSIGFHIRVAESPALGPSSLGCPDIAESWFTNKVAWTRTSIVMADASITSSGSIHSANPKNIYFVSSYLDL